MKIIAIINNKGGVGKTTSCFTIANYFARKGKKTLVMDLDPQSNLTFSFGLAIDHHHDSIYESAVNKKLDPLKIKDNLFLVPANQYTPKFNNDFNDSFSPDTIISRLLKKYSDDYDVCIIDTSPDLSLLTRNGLSCADSIYIPLKVGVYEAIGSKKLMDNIEVLEEVYNKKNVLKGLFFTMVDLRSNISKEVLINITNIFNGNILNSKIRNSSSILEATAMRTDVISYNESSTGALDYLALCDEIAEIEGIK